MKDQLAPKQAENGIGHSLASPTGEIVAASTNVSEQAQSQQDQQEHPRSHDEQEKLLKLPEPLKLGIEALSGVSMDDVTVHYNSSKPAEVQALAYAQQTKIYLGPGQEHHLAHEAWHIVQQKQGRVKPTLQIRGIAINQEEALEREADVMGNQALTLLCDTPKMRETTWLPNGQAKHEEAETSFAVIQRVFAGVLAGRTASDILQLVEGKYTYSSEKKGQIVTAIGDMETATETYSSVQEIVEALQKRALISPRTVRLYHTTRLANLEHIASKGLLIKQSGTGGFTSQAASISGDKDVEAKRVETSTGKIHLGNLAMALSYLNTFKMQSAIDAIVDPLVDERFAKIQSEALQVKPPQKVYAYTLKPGLREEVLKDPIVQERIAKINSPKGILVIHELFAEALYYDLDPDESSAESFRAVRKSKDIAASSLFILTEQGEISLQTYQASPTSYSLVDPEKVKLNEEDEAALEAFINTFSKKDS
jgi:hypothetical protein